MCKRRHGLSRWSRVIHRPLIPVSVPPPPEPPLFVGVDAVWVLVNACPVSVLPPPVPPLSAGLTPVSVPPPPVTPLSVALGRSCVREPRRKPRRSRSSEA